MPIITVVTSNKEKLAELTRLMPTSLKFTHQALDLPEIQSNDLYEIIKDKAHRAYQAIGGPVIVEDVAAGLNKFGGLPGPFIKFFEESLGQEALYTLAGETAAATVTCTMCYYDGLLEVIVQGIVAGTVVAPRNTSGFGFDIVFMPNGSNKTFAEMEPAEKDAVSHRSLAVQKLALKLEQLSKQMT